MSDSLDIPEPARGLGPLQTYTGGTATGEFVIDYYPAKTSSLLDEVPSLSNDLFTFNRVPRFVDSQPYLANAADAPFIYEDRRYLFYVRPAEDYVTLRTHEGFGVDLGSYRPSRAAYTIPKVIIRETQFPPPPIGDPVESFRTSGGATVDKTTLQSYLAAQGPNIKVSIGSRTLVTYQGQRMTPAGSLLAATATRQSAAVEKRS